jgi:hypothetical protein
MPYRRPTVPALLTAALLGAAGAGLSACSIDIPVDPGSVPAPFSQAPVPSASAGRSPYVCTAAYRTLTGGAAQLANGLRKSGDEGVTAIRGTLTSMAGELTAEAAVAEDPALGEALRSLAGKLTQGAARSDPKAYVQGDFQDIGKSLDPACK